MKIGVNTLFMIPSEVGGSETYLRNILKNLVSIGAEHEFYIFVNEENRMCLSRDLKDFSNVVIFDMHVRCVSKIARSICEHIKLPQVAKRLGLDLLWNPSNMCSIFLHPIPYVTTIHDMQYVHFPEDFSKMALYIMKFFTPMSARKSDVVVSVSEFSRQEIVRYAKVPFEKVYAIPSAAAEFFGEPLDKEFIKDRLITLLHSDMPYFLVVANTYPHKKVEDAILAYAQVARENKCRLVLLGKPRLGEAKVEEAISQLPKDVEIVRLSYVTESDLAVLYQGALAYVLPTMYEGFGLPVLEAMHAGIPVIASNVASVPEVGGDTILYTKCNDVDSLASAMRRVLNLSTQEREEIIQKQKQRAKKFSWKTTATELLKVFVDVVNERNFVVSKKS